MKTKIRIGALVLSLILIMTGVFLSVRKPVIKVDFKEQIEFEFQEIIDPKTLNERLILKINDGYHIQRAIIDTSQSGSFKGTLQVGKGDGPVILTDELDDNLDTFSFQYKVLQRVPVHKDVTIASVENFKTYTQALEYIESFKDQLVNEGYIHVEYNHALKDLNGTYDFEVVGSNDLGDSSTYQGQLVLTKEVAIKPPPPPPTQNPQEYPYTNPLLVLVNKDYAMPKNYPLKLETIPNELSTKVGIKVHPDALRAFVAMKDDHKASTGNDFWIASAYRDYNYQKNLFDRIVKNEGMSSALKSVAKAGHSEHHTGLVIDLSLQDGIVDNFGGTPQSEWISKNAHRYGFIVRYIAKDVAITGYMAEPWHLRFIGISDATEVYRRNIPLETYLK